MCKDLIVKSLFMIMVVNQNGKQLQNNFISCDFLQLIGQGKVEAENFSILVHGE